MQTFVNIFNNELADFNFLALLASSIFENQYL